MSHHSLPIGISVSRISPFGISCPWCPTTPNSISHLFHSCFHASLIWDKISLLCSFISSYHPSPINFIFSSQPHLKNLADFFNQRLYSLYGRTIHHALLVLPQFPPHMIHSNLFSILFLAIDLSIYPLLLKPLGLL